MRQDRLVGQQAHHIVDRRVARRLGVELFNPRDLALVLGNVRRDEEVVLLRQRAEPRHQLRRARRHEAAITGCGGGPAAQST